MEAWYPTTSTPLAAALSLLGCAVKIERSHDAATGNAHDYFFLGITNADAVREHGVIPVSARQLCHDIQEGRLERDNPAHPALAALCALRNAERILAWMKEGKAQRLLPYPSGAWAGYEPGRIEPPGKSFLTTTDLSAAAALGAFGFPVRRIESAGDRRVFHIALSSVCPAHAALDPAKLLRDAREKKLPPEHNFFYALEARPRFLQLRRVLDGEPLAIILRSKYKPRAGAYVYEGSPKVRFDEAAKFLNR